jgi:queuine tRNA-ribosyltransferase
VSRGLSTAHGELRLPAFLPDATRGVVRSLDSMDLIGSGIRAVVVNALHLGREPGMTVIDRAGGIHEFMGWPGPVLSDSGGFQAYSIISRSKSLGKITSEGFEVRAAAGGKRDMLTPEVCIDRQFRLGVDVMMCLDYCTHPEAPEGVQRESVDLTCAWARRCKQAFEVGCARLPEGRPRPLLFAVVQGGRSRDLRRECAARLLEIGFDGFGFGGWPVDGKGGLEESVGFTAGLLPADSPKMGLGIGTPENIVAAFAAGYRLFDCSLPTRDARRGRLFTRSGQNGPAERLDITAERYVRDAAAPEAGCDCLTCRKYSRSYLHHLFAIEDRLAWRLASIHNLRFYSRLLDGLRTRGDSA